MVCSPSGRYRCTAVVVGAMTIKVTKLPSARANQELVQLLAGALAEARKGDLRGVVMVKTYRNDETQSVWTVENCWSVQILGAIRMLMRDWEDRILEYRRDERSAPN